MLVLPDAHGAFLRGETGACSGVPCRKFRTSLVPQIATGPPRMRSHPAALALRGHPGSVAYRDVVKARREYFGEPRPSGIGTSAVKSVSSSSGACCHPVSGRTVRNRANGAQVPLRPPGAGLGLAGEV